MTMTDAVSAQAHELAWVVRNAKEDLQEAEREYARAPTEGAMTAIESAKASLAAAERRAQIAADATTVARTKEVQVKLDALLRESSNEAFAAAVEEDRLAMVRAEAEACAAFRRIASVAETFSAKRSEAFYLAYNNRDLPLRGRERVPSPGMSPPMPPSPSFKIPRPS